MKWVSGDLNTLTARLEATGESIAGVIAEVLQEVVDEARDDMRQIITDSVTPTGERRAGRGGAAGRIESGLMIESVTAAVGVDGTAIVGEFGWLENAQVYFRFQEEGTVRVMPMLALFNSWARASQVIVRKLQERGFTIE